MSIAGGFGWKLPLISNAVLEDKVRHADPIGTVELTCPGCSERVPMTCYRFSGGHFGHRHALHLVCGACGGMWTVDASESGGVLESLTPVGEDPPEAT